MKDKLEIDKAWKNIFEELKENNAALQLILENSQRCMDKHLRNMRAIEAKYEVVND